MLMQTLRAFLRESSVCTRHGGTFLDFQHWRVERREKNKFEASLGCIERSCKKQKAHKQIKIEEEVKEMTEDKEGR